jgi:hypothetical protein
MVYCTCIDNHVPSSCLTSYYIILWCTDPLLGKNLETDNETTVVAMQWLQDKWIYKTVSEQRLGKHVPKEMNTHVTVDLLWKRGVFCVTHAKMLWARQFEATSPVELCKWGSTVVELTVDKEFCKGGCGKRTWAQEAEESPLLEAVAREQLLKTLQAGEYLVCNDL